MTYFPQEIGRGVVRVSSARGHTRAPRCGGCSYITPDYFDEKQFKVMDYFKSGYSLVELRLLTPVVGSLGHAIAYIQYQTLMNNLLLSPVYI